MKILTVAFMFLCNYLDTLPKLYQFQYNLDVMAECFQDVLICVKGFKKGQHLSVFYSDLFQVIKMLVSITVLFSVCCWPTVIDNMLIAFGQVNRLNYGNLYTCVRLSPSCLTSTAVSTPLSTHSCQRTFVTVSGMHCACAAVDSVDVGINMGHGCEVSHTRQAVCGKVHFQVDMDQVNFNMGVGNGMGAEG